MGSNVASGNNESYGQDNQYYSTAQSWGQGFSENGDSEEHGCDRFQGSKDGCWGRAYVLDSLCGTQE